LKKIEGRYIDRYEEKKKVVNMYARVIQVPVDIDKMDAGIDAVDKAMQDVIQQLKGFAGSYLLVDRTEGKALYVGLYDSQEDADAVMQSGVTQDVISRLAEFMVGTPEIEGYEVALKP
jgi:quinol monooxygenase YgiN